MLCHTIVLTSTWLISQTWVCKLEAQLKERGPVGRVSATSLTPHGLLA